MKRKLTSILAVCLCFANIAQVCTFASSETSSNEFVYSESEYAEASETEVPDDNFVQGTLLFALDDADDLEGLYTAFADLGVSQIEPMFTVDGKASAMTANGKIWYKAQVTGDVLETVEAINELDGVVCSEPEYIYT